LRWRGQPSGGKIRGRRRTLPARRAPAKRRLRTSTSTRSASSVLPARPPLKLATEAARCGVLPLDVPTTDKSEANGPPCLWKTSTHYWRSRFPARVITCVCDQGSTKGLCDRKPAKRRDGGPRECVRTAV